MGAALQTEIVAVGVCRHLKVKVKCLSRGVDSTGSEDDLGKHLANFPRAHCLLWCPEGFHFVFVTLVRTQVHILWLKCWSAELPCKKHWQVLLFMGNIRLGLQGETSILVS